MRRSVCCSALAALLITSCGIFDPRPAEYPSTTVQVDPFNFASILWNTGKQITTVAYSDIFYDGMDTIYYDINDKGYSRTMFIANLQDAITRYVIGQVSWNPDSLSDFTIGDTFFVDRAYHIVLQDTMMIPTRSDTFNNNASFKLIFNANKNTWNIFYFKDKYPGMSIFNPLFQPTY
jgi:hypothetical protein